MKFLKPQNANQASDKETVKGEHASIGIEPAREVAFARTTHPDAQWYPDAGLGLFIHWGISSVKGMNISWPMIPGRPLARNKVSAEECERIIREVDYNLNGKPPEITPNEYWTKRRTGAASYQSYLSYRAATPLFQGGPLRYTVPFTSHVERTKIKSFHRSQKILSKTDAVFRSI